MFEDDEPEDKNTVNTKAKPKPPADPTDTKKRKSTFPNLLRKAHQYLKQAEQSYQRDEGKSEADLVKLRSIFCDAIPGIEKQLSIARIMDEPGVRAFVKSMTFRV